MVLPKRVGGRPRHAWVKEAILCVVAELRIGTAGMIHRGVEQATGRAVGVNTVKRHLVELVDEGRVQRKIYSSRFHAYMR